MKNVFFNIAWALFGVIVIPIILLLVGTGINWILSQVFGCSFESIHYSGIWIFYTLGIIIGVMAYFIEMTNHNVWKSY